MDNYYNELVEVDAILNYLNEEDYNKIPQNIINAIKENKNKNYTFNYDDELELKEQHLLKETRAILYNLFRDYLATPEQKSKIEKWQHEDRIKVELSKQEDLKKDIIFPKETTNESNTSIEQLQVIEYKDSIFRRILGWFKKILKR